MNTAKKNILLIALIGLVITSIYSCSSQKDTIANKKLQNLSARYNLIYNSNVLLTDYLERLNQSNTENFNNFLPLYYAPQMADVNTAGTQVKELDEIDQKARIIIAEKSFSNYLDEAYILLGKTNFLQGKFYNAAEYFDYVSKTYNKEHNIYLNALNWKARSFIELNEIATAEKILDTVLIALDSVKRHKSEPLATLAQISILKKEDKKAIEYLEKALRARPTSSNKIKWTYTLAQLYEGEKDFKKSLITYQKVEKSNAPFEMYFNAKLSKIRITQQLDGKEFSRKLALTKMLKDDKHADFKDQIFYEIAEDYYADKDYGEAENYYKLSVKNSTVNNIQKGFSYLKIADLNFTHYSDYVTAKLYYDSTLLSLPKNHTLYNSINTKSQNLGYLKERYESIKLQDTLQRIALMSESARSGALSNYFAAMDRVSTPVSNITPNASNGRADATYNKAQTEGAFYFANATAISRGFNEFTKRWGNRKLANNWRQSVKSGSQPPADAADFVDAMGALPSNPDAAPGIPLSSRYISYLDSLPLTPVKLETSNQKIIDAYIEMGNFYLQVLKDKPEAIKTYETLLRRFPNNDKLDLLYYGLYLSYQGINNSKSNEYRNLILAQYPSSVFAKSIVDPSFSMKQSQLEATLITAYEKLLSQLQQKKYKDVIAGVDEINQRFPGNTMAPQYSYLKSIAVGRTQKVDKLILAFNHITETYKADNLITPLVRQHLLFINANFAEFNKRNVALVDYDTNEIPFAYANNTRVRMNEPIIANLNNPTGKKIIETPAPEAMPEEKPNAAEKIVQQAPVKTAVITPPVEIKKDSVIIPPVSVKQDSIGVARVVKKDTVANLTMPNRPIDTIAKTISLIPVKEDLFNPASSNNYYYVVAINSVNTSVSSSRFGIGQFNRGNYAGENLRHQLKELDKDQLIIVGDFNNIADVKRYEQSIKSQLGVIMKVPAAIYTTFAISKENLDKINNHETLKRYIRYINSNEL